MNGHLKRKRHLRDLFLVVITQLNVVYAICYYSDRVMLMVLQFMDDDNNVYCEFEYSFDIAKDWK